LGFLGVDDIGHVDQLVVPGIKRDDFCRVVLEQVGDHPAGDRRNDLLVVIGDELLERYILLLGEALHPPHLRGLCRRLGNIGLHHARRCRKRQTATQHRSPIWV
jgi:hypothetical protein